MVGHSVGEGGGDIQGGGTKNGVASMANLKAPTVLLYAPQRGWGLHRNPLDPWDGTTKGSHTRGPKPTLQYRTSNTGIASTVRETHDSEH